jgi:DNA repair protein RadC
VRSYWNRRERLRQCVIAAGAENLPDYELLEVMLFASNPKAKVEALTAELLQRFGSLAEVLGANPAELAAAGLGVPPSPRSSLSATSLCGLCGRNCAIAIRPLPLRTLR